MIRTIAETSASSAESELQSVLRDLAKELEGTQTLVVGDRNALPIVSNHRGPATLAATASATIVLAAARNVASTSALSPLEDVLLEGADYKVLVRSIGNGFTLLAVLVGDVNLGMAKLLMAHKAREIGELLEMLG
jgi:predicted regulator of Ras-like GTPase activity (Roadblock/LC7/MglB family)